MINSLDPQPFTPPVDPSNLEQPILDVQVRASKKFFWYLGGGLLTMALLAAGIYAFINQSPAKTNTQDNAQDKTKVALAGELTLAEGRVQIKQQDSWVTASQGQSLKAGQAVKTGANSRAVVSLDDGSAIRLDQSSEIVLQKLTAQEILINQTSGRSYHRVEPGQVTYKVETTQATATALGTIFTTESSADQSKIAVAESKVEVENKVDKQKQTVTSGQQAVVNKDQTKVEDLSQDYFNHDFIKWNYDQDKDKADKLAKAKATPTPTPTVQPTTLSQNNGPIFQLSATKAGAGKVTLNWKVSGLNAPKGFKIIKAHHNNPTFGKDEAVYLDKNDARSYTWSKLEGKATYFRIGIYNGSGIDRYSNIIAITPEPKPAAKPYTGAITITGATWKADKSSIVVNFTATNDHLVDGWKVAVSKSPNPVYPDHSKAFVNPQDRTAWIGDFQSGDKVYIRVGAWIDGTVASNAYSNQFEYIVP